MDWQARYYPIDVFPSIAARVEELIASGRFFAPELVKEEVGVVGSAGLTQWTRDHEGIFVPTAELLAAAQIVQNQFPALRDPRAEYEEADSYVIALARMRQGVVVTQETPAAEKRNPRRSHFIPDVCRELGLPCTNLLGLIRAENWSL